MASLPKTSPSSKGLLLSTPAFWRQGIHIVHARGILSGYHPPMSNSIRFRKVAMGIAVCMLLLGGVGSISSGRLDATAIMALSLASSLILLDLAGTPRPRSPRAIIGFALLATAIGAALVMIFERISS